MDSAFGKKVDDPKRVFEHLQLISANDALVLFCASCSPPKLMHVARSSFRAGHTLQSNTDYSFRFTLNNITNNITDEQWRQANLSVKAGGIGVRSFMSIAPSAFLS